MRLLGCAVYLTTLACMDGLGLASANPVVEPITGSGSADVHADAGTGTDTSAARIDEIVVTGTRLPLNATVPVTVLSRHDVVRNGANSVGDVLQALPMNAGSPLNTNVNIGAAEPFMGGVNGDGSVRVALRGLSTVVLLNGRRFPASGLGADSSVDLNTLPVSFIERVEVMASGASAVYGADAVGGVVNIITRRDSGLSLAGSRTVSEHGDGVADAGEAALGLDAFGGSWIVGLEYVEQGGVTLDRRTWSAIPLLVIDGDGNVGPLLNRATPQGRITVPAGNRLGMPAGVYTHVDGTTGRTADDYRRADPLADAFNFAPFNYLQTPNERGALWLIGSQPLATDVNLFAEGLLHHRESQQATSPSAFYATPDFAPRLDGDGWGIPADNYYNPFGVDIRWLPTAFPPLARRLSELGNRGFSEEVDLWRLLIGLEGRLRGWSWSVSAARAQAEASGVEIGAAFPSRILRALGPSGPDEDGRIVCGKPDPDTGLVPAANVVTGCVPLDLFGGAGSIASEQLDYIAARSLTQTGTNEQDVLELVLRGPWGQLDGRALQWVVGADYRNQAGSFVPDPRRAAEFEESSLTGGSYVARELFAELQVPLVQNIPFARAIDVNLGARWSDFSSFDNHVSWQAGVRWQPADEWTVRAHYADVFRAPELFALHDPRGLLRAFDLDPCGNEPTPRQRANCEANGVPGGAYVQGEEEFEVLAGGNPDLEPETGHSLGVGLLYAPRWADGLSIGVDYYRTEIGNLISQLFVDQALFECAEHGLPEVCDDIERFPDGRVRRVSTFNENFAGGYETSGVDVTLDWSGTTPMGELGLSVLATYLERWDEQALEGGSVFHYAGTFSVGAMPRWRGLGTADWQSGRWYAGYTAEYIGSYTQLVERTPFGMPFEPYTRRLEPVLYHDVEVAYTFDNGFALRAGVTNVTDEDPPFVNRSPANTDPGTYRLLGRSYFLELRFAQGGLRQ